MKSKIFDKNGTEVKVGSLVSFPYVDPGGNVTDEIGFVKTVEFNFGCFGYWNETKFIPLMEWMKTERGDYVSNCGNKTVYTEKYFFEVKNK